MRKAAVGIALLAAIACAGCNQQPEIKGSVETVVKKAQDYSNDDKPKVEVSGTLEDDAEVDTSESAAFMFGDDSMVNLIFSDKITTEQAEKMNSGRFTAVGTLDPSMTTDKTVVVVVDEIK